MGLYCDVKPSDWAQYLSDGLKKSTAKYDMGLSTRELNHVDSCNSILYRMATCLVLPWMSVNYRKTGCSEPLPPVQLIWCLRFAIRSTVLYSQVTPHLEWDHNKCCSHVKLEEYNKFLRILFHINNFKSVSVTFCDVLLTDKILWLWPT